MSVHFISGKPGGGKTLYGVKLILEELVYGDRPIVTNCPLRLGRLNEYVQEKYPQAFRRRFFWHNWELDGTPPDLVLKGRKAVEGNGELHHISDEILLLEDDDLVKFFTFRPRGVRLASVTNEEWRQGKRPDYSLVKDNGVFYVLDEVHIAFNARAWATTGHEVLYYLSQHRKLGDDVVCITQSIGNVDKQFRSVAQDFTYIKNLKKQKMGLFKLPGIFLRSTYAQPVTDTSKAMESGSFSLDVSGLASCYDTAKGVGIHGRAGADTRHRQKGIHWLYFVILLPLVLWAIYHWGPRTLAHTLFKQPVVQPQEKIRPVSERIKIRNGGSTLPLTAPSQENQKIQAEVPNFQKNSDPSFLVQLVTNSVYCTGYVLRNGGAVVTLSDGTVWNSDDGAVQQVGKHLVIVGGKEYEVRRAKEVPYVPAPVETPQVFYGRSDESRNAQPVVGVIPRRSVLPGATVQTGTVSQNMQNSLAQKEQ